MIGRKIKTVWHRNSGIFERRERKGLAEGAEEIPSEDKKYPESSSRYQPPPRANQRPFLAVPFAPFA